MAPSSKNILLVVLVVLAALQLRPSAAIRGKVAQQSTVRPQFFFFFPPFPCVPGFPWNLLPCYQPAPAPPLNLPTECWTSVMNMARPCAEYLTTNASVSSPPSECCYRFNVVNEDFGMCLCHVGNGDIGKLLPAPLNMTQLNALPYACGYDVRLQVFSHCHMRDVPPMIPPPGPTPPAA